jgi:hypothetical protein
MLNFVVRLIKKLNMACHLQVCQQQTYQDFLDMGDPEHLVSMAIRIKL